MSTTIPSTIAYRLQYTDGMFLTAGEMATEQAYFVNMAALQNSMLYTAGTLSGLAVSQTGPNTLAVTAGGGFDEAGNFLVLPSGGNGFTVSTAAANPSLLYLIAPSAADQTKGMPSYTVNMAGVLKLFAAGAAAPPNSVVLAQLGLDDKGAVTSITDKRVPVASRLGTPLDNANAIAAPVPGNNTVQGVLTVPADQLPTADKPFVATIYFNDQHTPAFATAPKVVTQVMGAVPYPTSVGSPTATTHFVLTIAASPVTPSSDTPQAPVQVTWWAFA